MKPKISILGCGWLGWPLAQELLTNKYQVKGSTTTLNKLRLLDNSGIEAHLLNLNNSDTDFEAFLDNSEILIVNVPPKAKDHHQLSYVDKMKLVSSAILKSDVQKVIFVSSTSVYADDNSLVTESTKVNPQTDSGKLLVESEQLFINTDIKTTILRFGGLIGGDRHPIYSLAGRTGIQNPHAAVNLIQRADCIDLIKKLIENDIWNEIFNAVSPEHPTRETYYTSKATELKLDLPIFDHTKSSVGKTISAEKIAKTLNFHFSTI